MISVVVGPVLRAIVGSGVGGISIGSRVPIPALLLLVVDGHEVLHVHGVLPLLVCPNADRGKAEQDRGDQGEADSDPGNDVAPVILELSVSLQVLKRLQVLVIYDHLHHPHLGPGGGEELSVCLSHNLVPLPVLHSVPQPHSSGME